MGDLPASDCPGCYFNAGLEVRELPGRGRGVFATQALAEGDLLVIERCLFALPEPISELRIALPGLFPRSLSEAPRWLFGWPIGLLPLGRASLTFLQLQLNCYWRGLYSFGAQFNHSCAPTAVRYIWADGWSIVFSLQAMEAGAEVSVCYGFLAHSYSWQRRWGLLWKYGFLCQCSRCVFGSPLPKHLVHLCRGEDALLAEEDPDFQSLGPWLFATCEGSEATMRSLAKHFPTAPTARQRAALELIVCRVGLRGEEVTGVGSGRAERSLAAASAALEAIAPGAPRPWLRSFADGEGESLFEAAMMPVAEARWLLSVMLRQCFGMLLLGMGPVLLGFMDVQELKEVGTFGVGLLLPCGLLGVLLRLFWVRTLGEEGSTTLCTVLLHLLFMLSSLATGCLVICFSEDGFSDILKEVSFWQELEPRVQGGLLFFATYGAAAASKQPLRTWARLQSYEAYVQSLVGERLEEKCNKAEHVE